LRLVQILDAMRATGMPLPEDLVGDGTRHGERSSRGKPRRCGTDRKTQSSPKTQSDLKRSK
jgi:hypothetical protein